MILRAVTVVICAYTLDRWDLLVRAIESVRAQIPAPGELVVVADHNDELRDRLTATFADLTVIPNAHGQGLSGARNSGIEASRGDVVAFLDDDAAAHPGWLTELDRGYDDPSVAGVGGAIEAEWVAGRPRWFPVEFDWVVGCSYRGQPTEVAVVRNPIGANMSFRRSVFDAVGGFRHGLGRIGETPVGGEETELCIRAARVIPGATFLLRPSARVSHAVPARRGTIRYFLRRCYSEGLSKAVIARIAGGGAALANERSYATRTLPLGVVRGVRDLHRGDAWGILRATAIVSGLLVTTAGYIVGSIGQRSSQTSSVAAPSGIGPA